MADATVQFFLRDKLACTLCQEVVLTLDDGTTQQELTAVILYESPNQPQAGYWLYTVQYDDADLLVSSINACTIKSVRCKSCCDEIRDDAKWSVQEIVSDSEVEFVARVADVAGADSDNLVLAAKDLYVKCFITALGVDSITAAILLQIADDALGTGIVTIDKGSTTNLTGAGEVITTLQVGGIIPKGKYWRLAATMTDTPFAPATFNLAIMESF